MVISRMKELSLFPRQTIQHHSNSSLCHNHQCWRSQSWTILWKPARSPRTNTSKICSFHHKGLQCKSRKSRDTWSNRQVGLGLQNEAGQKLTEFCPENTLVIKNNLFHQHKRWYYTWRSPSGQYKIDWLYSLQWKMAKLYTVSKNKSGSWLCLRTWTPYCQIQT